MWATSWVCAAVWQTHAVQRRSLRKRDHRKLPFESCCTDELPACVPEAIRSRGARWKPKVCAVSPAPLWPGPLSCSFSVCLPAPPFREAGMRLMHTLIYAAGSWDVQGGEDISGAKSLFLQLSVWRCCLTSFIAFLWSLGLPGETRVQPGGGLAVVTEVQKGDMYLIRF